MKEQVLFTCVGKWGRAYYNSASAYTLIGLRFYVFSHNNINIYIYTRIEYNMHSLCLAESPHGGNYSRCGYPIDAQDQVSTTCTTFVKRSLHREAITADVAIPPRLHPSGARKTT